MQELGKFLLGDDPELIGCSLVLSGHMSDCRVDQTAVRMRHMRSGFPIHVVIVRNQIVV